MNGFWGADTEALRTMGAVCARRADVLDELEGRLTAVLDGIEWTGEDAERFRADWAGTVRPGLQDRGVELRQQARRLAQHAEEQEAASRPDSFGGPWASPGEFLADRARLAEGVLRDLLGGVGGAGAGVSDGAAGRFAELLREALSTPEGRAAFLGAFLGSLLGGLLADLLLRGLALGMLLEELLAGLGAGGGAGAGIGEVIGEDGRLGGSGASGEGGGAGSGTASESGSEGSETGGSGGGADGGSGGGSSSGGGGSSSGAGTVADSSSGADAAETGAEGAGATTGSSSGLQGLVDGPAQTAGSTPAGRLDLGGDEEPGTLFERLIAMIGEMLGGASGGGDAASPRGTSAIGEGIGWG